MGTKQAKSETMTIRTDENIKNAVFVVANREGKSMSEVINRALEEDLEIQKIITNQMEKAVK